MTADELAARSEQFKLKLAETEVIIRECEMQCAQIAARWGGRPWPR